MAFNWRIIFLLHFWVCSSVKLFAGNSVDNGLKSTFLFSLLFSYFHFNPFKLNRISETLLFIRYIYITLNWLSIFQFSFLFFIYIFSLLDYCSVISNTLCALHVIDDFFKQTRKMRNCVATILMEFFNERTSLKQPEWHVYGISLVIAKLYSFPSEE